MRICQIKELILKPCPFCGGNAIICASKGESIKDNKYISNIVCSCCDAAVQGVIASSMLEADIKAAKLWNKRTAVIEVGKAYPREEWAQYSLEEWVDDYGQHWVALRKAADAAGREELKEE